MAFYFDTEVFHMLQKYPFYGAITQQLERVIDTSCPSAAVAFKDNKYFIYANPEFMEKLSDADRTAVLVHEILHVALGHTWRLEGINTEHIIKNLAADLVVNQYVKFENLPGAITIDKYGFPPHLTVHEYINLLKQYMQDNPQSGEGDGQSGGGEGDGEGQSGDGNSSMKDRGDANSHEWAKAQDDGNTIMKEVIGKNILEHAIAQNHGKIPLEVEQEIKNLLMIGKIPWTQIIRRFVDNSRKYLEEPNRFKPNRRQPTNIMAPGKRRIDLSKLLIGIDTSGSVSEEEISYFLSEVVRIAATKTEITIVECDAEIHKTYSPTNIHKIQTQVKGRGGTDFNPVFKYAKENKFKYVVYFTDLECNNPKDEYKHIHTIWVVQKSKQKRPVSFGTVIAID